MAFVLFPCEVRSKNDGQTHYILAPQLAQLYGVDYKICKVVYLDKPESVRQYKKEADDIELHPDYHGRYQLP